MRPSINKSISKLPACRYRESRPTLWQFWCFRICRTTFMDEIKFDDLLLVRLRKLWRGRSGFPTNPFTIFELQNSSQDVLELHEIRRSPDLWNCERVRRVIPKINCSKLRSLIKFPSSDKTGEKIKLLGEFQPLKIRRSANSVYIRNDVWRI